jgi:hypothetical protein
MYDEICTGGYECEAWSHAAGCLSHTIDPPSELELASTVIPDITPAEQRILDHPEDSDRW